MRESRFIELLNLYVDQQISPMEAAALEREIARSPARLRTYRQYCRIQRACRILFDEAQQQAPESAALNEALLRAEEKVVAFPVRPRRNVTWTVWGSSLAGVAAAACVAFMLLRAPAASPEAADSVPTPGIASADKPAEVIRPRAATVQVASDSNPAVESRNASVQPVNYAPAYSSPTFSLAYALGQPATAPSTLQADATAQWMSSIELAPLRRTDPDSLILTLDRSEENGGSRLLRPRQNTQGAEFIGFQFQR